MLRKTKIHHIKIDLSLCKYIIKTAVYFALYELLWMIYFKIDIVMLGKLKGETEVGHYNAAYVIINAIAFISMIFMQAIYPILSNLYKKDKNKFKETLEKSLRYLLFIVMMIVPITFILADKIINVIYGSDYSYSITALRILIFVIIFLFPVTQFVHTLAASNRHKTLAKINLVGVILNILLNFILIPRYGYIGAGVATIITELALCVMLYSAVSKLVKIRSFNIILKILPAPAAMTLVLYLGQSMPLLLVIFISFLSYFLLSYLTGSIKTEDFSWIYGILKKESKS